MYYNTANRPGGFAEAYCAECKGLGTVALKLYTNESVDFDHLFNEVKALAFFNDNPYSVKFIGASDIRAYHQYILMEYMEGDRLRKKMRETSGVDMDLTVRVGYFVAQALLDMHDVNMVHRNVCRDNIFFDNRGNIKLGDLGLAGKMNALRAPSFSAYHTAPEILEDPS